MNLEKYKRTETNYPYIFAAFNFLKELNFLIPISLQPLDLIYFKL